MEKDRLPAALNSSQNAEMSTPESGGQSLAAPAFSVTAGPEMSMAPAADAAAAPAPETLSIKPGELTTLGEGSDAATKYIHRPQTASSGVTLGKGYDIGSRTAANVITELTAAGMSTDQATKVSLGAGLTGSAADTWIAANKTDIGEIPSDVQYALLATMLEDYKAKAKDAATNTTADSGNVNAAAREVKDGVEAGTYVMTEAQWDGLHPAMIELLTDLKYQGGYYGYDRVAKINALLITNDGNHLEQFKAVATLFDKGDEAESYMDTYGKGIGEGSGNTELFYGQASTDIAGATTRRNRVRLSYLKQIITALEGGKTVSMALPAPAPEVTTPVVGPQ
jgi:hypothetical protein